jgi:tripartite-type tricarboxylate transporter receptor subunit TctC
VPKRHICKLIQKHALGLLAAVGAACLLLQPAVAQERYPSKPVKLIMPFPATGPADLMARIYAQKLSERWGQPVVVENKTGATGTIGADIVAKAAPDGYTLLFTVDLPIVMAPALIKTPYDPRKAFAPVAIMAETMNMLVVHPSVGAGTLAELVAKAKANPGKLTYSSAGPASPGHLCAEMLRSAAGIDIVHVPYKGAAPALNDLLGGQIPMMFDSLPGVIQQIRAGKLRALGVTTLKRAPAAPDIPTIDESGVKGFEATAWFGLYAPGNMAPELARRLNADLLDVLRSQKIRTLFAEQGADPGTLSQADFATFVNDEMVKWGKVIITANVKLD